MDAGEPLAKGNPRDRHLWDHICADQRATDSSFEPASCCFARSGIDDFDWRDDAGARLSRSQLRHAGPVARHDADLGVSLSGALFRKGRRCRPEVLADAAAAVDLSDAYVWNSIPAARQRFGIPITILTTVAGTFVLLMLH